MSESPAAEERRPLKKSRLWSTVKALTRTRIMAGLIVVLPIYVTILVIHFVFEVMRDQRVRRVEVIGEDRAVFYGPESGRADPPPAGGGGTGEGRGPVERS